MAILTVGEIIDLLIMTAAVGYIFLDIFKMPQKDEEYDPLKSYRSRRWNDFWFACMVTAPAIILHEMAHKFVGLFYGLQATFHAAYTWLGLGIILKIFGGMIFFVPGYVSLSPSGPLESAVTAFAGPAFNLILFLGATLLLRSKIKLSHTWQVALIVTKKLNLFLFCFNMIPLGFFDGAKVFSGLLTYFGY